MHLIRIVRCSRGTAIVEFALMLPLFLMLGLFGAEIANMTSANMAISQLALSVADNASRLGQTVNSGVTPTITESDVDAVLYGALKQGAPIGLSAQGRVILTSLEKDPATGKQYIHWQRCRGSLVKSSAYGNDGALNGLAGSVIAGLGQGTQKITAKANSAVMYAEVFYQYKGLFGSMFGGNMTMKREAAFIVRDDRNLTPGLTGGSSGSTC